MLMRVSTATAFRAPVESMIRQQAEMERTQREVSSGQKLQALADNPAQAARVSDLDRYLSAAERYSANAGFAADRLKLGDLTATAALDLIQRVRELTVAGASDALDVSARRAIAQEARGLSDQLLALANRPSESGEYLFAGSKSNAVPFVRMGGTVTYQGDSVEREVPISPTRRIADGFAGDEVFMDITRGNGAFVTGAAGANTGRAVIDVGTVVNGVDWGTAATASPNGYKIVFSVGSSGTTYSVKKHDDSPLSPPITGVPYQPGQALSFLGAQVTVTGAPANGDVLTVVPVPASGSGSSESVFATLDRLVAAMETADLSGGARARISTELNGVLHQVDQAMNSLSDARSSAGARLRTIEESEAFAEEQEILIKDDLSKLRDVDFAEALARLNAQMTALQVAQQAYSRIANRSLFDYL